MLNGFNANQDEDSNEFHQRVADQNIQSIISRQDEIQHAKNGFIGMLAGIFVGGIVGWIFLSPTDNLSQEKDIPVIRRQISPVKIQPNEPGGMEIDNQNREIYHIVDNSPKKIEKVNVQPLPETPKIVVENTIPVPENMDALVENIEEEENPTPTPVAKPKIVEEKTSVKLADTNLSVIKTNSQEKITIPQKIKDLGVTVQKSVQSGGESKVQAAKVQTETKTKDAEPTIVSNSAPAEKGTWYAQIIASSSRTTVENLWKNLSSKYSFLKSYSHEIEEIKVSGNTLYRLKVGAFKTRSEAENLTAKLKQNQIAAIIKQN